MNAEEIKKYRSLISNNDYMKSAIESLGDRMSKSSYSSSITNSTNGCFGKDCEKCVNIYDCTSKKFW